MVGVEGNAFGFGIMNTRNVNDQNHHQRGRSFNGFANINTTSSHVSGKLGRLSFESAKVATSGIDDLLSSTEGGKHDYDWLLTPPGTPNLPSSECESKPTLTPQRSSLCRSVSNTNVSRLSVTQPENNNQSQSKPARSSSVSRSSSNKSSSIHNTARPSSPITRSPSAATRPSTPSRVVRSSSSSDTNKVRTSQASRPSTPTSTSRPHIPVNIYSPPTPARPSTPTRRLSMPFPSPTTTSAPRVGRNSPGPRPLPVVVPPDFPLDTPPNLRTTLPDRPISAGRSRPGAVVTLKPNSETQTPPTMSRRQSSPLVNRGRLSEYIAKSRVHANAAEGRVSLASDLLARKSVKSSTTTSTTPENNALGRTISKKSLDMAIRHMDIRNGSGTHRSVPSATLFPQSIRTSTPKAQHTRRLSAPDSVNINRSIHSRNSGACFDIGNSTNKRMNGRERQYFGRLSEVDVYESCPYDSLFLREDLKNTNWLHSVDDKCDHGPIFDNGFESLPEPFALL
ncbi:hypothetical protein RJT34_22423 [Clitoria ternatea]|uniref:Uncharacterized protein n=1 Tax=Clitoria ternatea TaxID=43366 RepID=A0AAN9P773_CLITE